MHECGIQSTRGCCWWCWGAALTDDCCRLPLRSGRWRIARQAALEEQFSAVQYGDAYTEYEHERGASRPGAT